MSRHDRRYQKFLDRQRQKHGHASSGPVGKGATPAQVVAASRCPIHEALVPAGLFERGIGNLLFSRSLPDGRLGVAQFLLDIFCLGAKNAFVAVVSRNEYALRMRKPGSGEILQPIEAACFRKLVEGSVAYAGNLGLRPHADYALASQIFADVNSAECSTSFEYGKDGKPFYCSGPNETEEDIEAVLDCLTQRVGSGNFDYLVTALGDERDEGW
jgi:hypothetical protein